MIRPDPEIVARLANIATHNKEIVQWLNNWRQHELEQLPNVSSNAVGIAQGRCQVLTELCKLVNNSREFVAQSNKR
jgi:hypothetical protein